LIGGRGGDVRFSRAISDIALYLKQSPDMYVSLFVDYAGIRKWPGLSAARQETDPERIAGIINEATHKAIMEELPPAQYHSDVRFIPHIAVHEFEALLFSNPVKLAAGLNVDASRVEAIIHEFDDPEKINTIPATYPSRRIASLYQQGKARAYSKPINGLAIAKTIGIDTMRRQCRVFNNWLTRLENIAHRA